MPDASSFLNLRDRAYALVTRGPVGEEELLAHVLGGTPPAPLRERMLAPLLEDPRLRRLADGSWTLATRPDAPLVGAHFTALALTPSGPHPARGRIVRLAALHVGPEGLIERFTAVLNPGVRVPGYVARRAGLEPDVLYDLPAFESIVDDLTRFLDQRPICAQEAHLTWAFVRAAARRLERTLPEPLLLDVNDLADRLLELDGKPSLGLVAQRLGISFTRIDQCDEEARIVAVVVPWLLARAAERGISALAELGQVEAGDAPLRRTGTARALPDTPGVYVMRDARQRAVYVGKARRLRERVAAYVHRPLGATRRLEGLQGTVHAVEALECATDLEALILEAREIRRLQPRFNTVRQQRALRTWLRLPPQPEVVRGQRMRKAARLELASGPEDGPGEYLGPFRNPALAAYARGLAREVFALDELRQSDVPRYVEQLARAWRFVRGEGSDDALREARTRHAHGLLARARLGAVREYDPGGLLLPADPRHARFALVRPGPNGIEAFVLDRGVLLGWGALGADDVGEFVRRVLADAEPHTLEADREVVLRWLGAQRASARLVLLPDDPVRAADLVEEAVVALCS